MVFITEDLVRRKSEHNECEISTLEELSLHQCDIERIEHLDRWCRKLKILYLQANLVPKIESVSKLKDLEYLNLAVNNVERVEGLSGCESLNKLDLTANFVAELTSLDSLKVNSFLADLYMTGNPCTEYVGYRDYVIATLPQLKNLDGKEIGKAERIEAVQNYESVRCDVLRQQKIYLEKLKKERAEAKEKEENDGKAGFDGEWYQDTQNAHNKKEEKPKNEEDDFWTKPCQYTPESRLESYRHLEEEKRKKEEDQKSGSLFPDPPKRVVRFFNDAGEPMNVNQAKMNFHLEEDDENGQYILEVPCYKHLDTSLIDADVQPNYVRVMVKGKALQLVLREEVSPDASTAQRSQVTGHLLVTMPKARPVLRAKDNNRTTGQFIKAGKVKPQKAKNKENLTNENGAHQRLEVDPTLKSCVDVSNIVSNDKNKSPSKNSHIEKPLNIVKLQAEEDFIDDPDVPPLL